MQTPAREGACEVDFYIDCRLYSQKPELGVRIEHAGALSETCDLIVV